MSNALSYWEKTSFFNYDVIIIGSGIVGLSSAIHLKKRIPSLKIALLDRGFLPSGASTKNAGFACFGSISELIEQEQICGTDGLAKLIAKRWSGLNKLRHLLGDHNMDYQNLGGYEIFKNKDHALTHQCVSKIEHYNHLIQDVVGKNAFEMEAQKVDAFGLKGIETLISNQYEAQIDPGKMMSSLILYAQKQEIFLFNNSQIDQINTETNGLTLSGKQGTFHCKKVLVATNAFINTLFPDLDILPGRGQVLVTSPVKNLKIRGTFHYDKGYYYFRNINGRLLLGGGRNLDFATEATTLFGETEKIQLALENLLHEVILPQTNVKIEHRWSGIMAFGKSLEPIIKEVQPNVFCAVRCNGMGIAMGSQTGEDAAELVLESL